VLRQEPVDRALIFTRTKHGADKVVRSLIRDGITAEAIHGNKSQNHRERVLAAFRNGTVKTLVATDIAARGIDVDGISHVVNFDLPNVPETYVHRIGRTARAGAAGIAISLCDGEEVAFLRDIEKLIRVSIPMTDRRSDQRQQDPPRQQERRQNEPRQGRPPANHASNRPHKSDKNRHWRQGKRHQQSRGQQPTQNNGGIETVAFMNRQGPSHRGRPQQRRSGQSKGQ
jgi:ATP-dependent RNA helicase RhlE